MKCDKCGSKDNLFVLMTKDAKIEFYCNECMSVIVMEDPVQIYQIQILNSTF